jgi:hypothetical protein
MSSTREDGRSGLPKEGRGHDPPQLIAGVVVENWMCTVPYGCKLEDLLAILHDRAPAKADAVVLQRRRVEHGLLSVGLKIHCLR